MRLVRQRISLFQSTPSGGKATGFRQRVARDGLFQSTPSGGKATWICRRQSGICGSFNPRLPGGRRPPTRRGASSGRRAFQSTPSGGKATSAVILRILSSGAFQSTPSGGKATLSFRFQRGSLLVSIHAFRGEGDFFYVLQLCVRHLFQSTPSGGKATSPFVSNEVRF